MDVTTTAGETASTLYTSFAVGNESTDYRLSVSGYTESETGDRLSYHSDWGFSTHDHDVDAHSINCAEWFTGAWWFKNCYNSNLNGAYGSKFHWHSLLTSSVMRVRRQE